MLNFSDNPNIEKLHEEEIWVYRNFLSKEEISEIYRLCKSLEEDSWHAEGGSDNTIEFYNGRTSRRISELLPVKEKITSIVQGYNVTPGETFVRMFPTDTMHEHEDSCGDEGTPERDDNNTCAITRYGCVVYINDDFEGGELYYPHLNMSYTPSAGDLVIHGSRITHGVAEVKSGIRYVYPTFLY
jgi:hypothetical protein